MPNEIPDTKNTTEDENLIPPQYENLPNDVVEKLWDNTIYTDSKKTEAEKIRREKAIQQIKDREEANKIRREMEIPEQENTENDLPESIETKDDVASTPERNMEIIKSDLENLANDHYLILHQAWNDSAKAITESSEYFSESGISGTALVNQDVDSILSTCKELDAPITEREKVTHRGANSMVVLAFPKTLINNHKDIEDKIDEVLVDQMLNKKIDKLGLPRNFVFGYYYNGAFNKNTDFKPEFH